MPHAKRHFKLYNKISRGTAFSIMLHERPAKTQIRPRGYKHYFMPNSAEHEICHENKSQITNNCKFFLAKHFMLSWVEYEKSSITSGPAWTSAQSDRSLRGTLGVAEDAKRLQADSKDWLASENVSLCRACTQSCRKCCAVDQMSSASVQ